MFALVGDDARGVTVRTYHARALRLTGTSLAGSESQGRTIDFDQLLGDAVDLLEGRTDGFADADEARLSLRYVALMCYSQRRIGASACRRRPFVYRKN